MSLAVPIGPARREADTALLCGNRPSTRAARDGMEQQAPQRVRHCETEDEVKCDQTLEPYPSVDLLRLVGFLLALGAPRRTHRPRGHRLSMGFNQYPFTPEPHCGPAPCSTCRARRGIYLWPSYGQHQLDNSGPCACPFRSESRLNRA